MQGLIKPMGIKFKEEEKLNLELFSVKVDCFWIIWGHVCENALGIMTFYTTVKQQYCYCSIWQCAYYPILETFWKFVLRLASTQRKCCDRKNMENYF